ncbi:UNVERIFIED_CONTAM: putative mitochondrial protein [Sesamum latifolium]|uniref:Mitochondrial protein n=1 Tax=Sesamum latifolium TaxID=2727402 RepID=A0AAW2SNT8_9LAMI
MVVQAIPSYAMSCFLLPKTLLKKFQSLAADFFWHDGDRRRIHWLAWDKMCLSKLDGGLGFCKLEAFNLALLAKQLWRLLTRPNCLVSKVLKAKYFPRNHLFDAQVSSPSAALTIWRCQWPPLRLLAPENTGLASWSPATSPPGLGGIEPSLATYLRPGTLSGRLWSRNLHSLGKAFLLPQQIVDFARSYLLLSFCKVLHNLMDNKGISLVGFPPVNKVKINFDGALLEGGAIIGVGIIARDSAGACLVWQSLRLERKGSALVAEAYAARATIQLAWRLQWQEVLLEGDCALLVSRLSTNQQDLSVVGSLVSDIRSLMSQFELVSFTFVRRSDNCVADYLSHLALNQEGNSFSLPAGLDTVLGGDLAT